MAQNGLETHRMGSLDSLVRLEGSHKPLRLAIKKRGWLDFSSWRGCFFCASRLLLLRLKPEQKLTFRCPQGAYMVKMSHIRNPADTVGKAAEFHGMCTLSVEPFGRTSLPPPQKGSLFECPFFKCLFFFYVLCPCSVGTLP